MYLILNIKNLNIYLQETKMNIAVQSVKKPTMEQQRAVDKAMTLKSSFKLIAFAGTGKTTTLILISNALKTQGKRGLYLAFNKKMAQEASLKFNEASLDNVDCSTFHALALKNVPAWLKAKINKPQLFPKDIAEKFNLEPYEVIYHGKNRALSSLVLGLTVLNTLKYYCMSDDKNINGDHAFEAIKEQAYISRNEQFIAKITSIAKTIWDDICDESGEYGISHDYYLKWWVNQRPTLNYDFYMLDESQDADALILSVLKRQKAKTIYVGDSHQQIYSFRCAHNLLQKLECEALYLQQSFRFGPDVARLANLILNQILDEDRQLKGLPGKRTNTELLYAFHNEFPIKDLNAVICRTNAKAFEYYFKYAEYFDGTKKIRMEIEGDRSVEIFKGICNLRSGKAADCAELKAFRTFGDLVEHVEIHKEFDGSSTELSTYLELSKKYSLAVIEYALENSKSQNNGAFSDCLVISTAHKAKGLEFNNVLIAEGFNYKIVDERLSIDKEEARLIYVAVTRAKSNLFYDGISDLVRYLEIRASKNNG